MKYYISNHEEQRTAIQIESFGIQVMHYFYLTFNVYVCPYLCFTEWYYNDVMGQI